jgi:glycosyltransferase involved in cell wall biosynthesis
MVVPSRQDNLPQTSTEPQACGTPVVAFDVCGLPSAVAHKQTGYLAKPFDTDDLAYGISWVLSDRERWQKLSAQARERAVRLWSPEVVIKQYLEVYEAAIAMRKRAH